MSEPKARQATESEIEIIATVTDPIADVLMSLPGQMGLHALCMLAETMVMNAVTDIPKVEAWDYIAASIRRTIEENVRRCTQ